METSSVLLTQLAPFCQLVRLLSQCAPRRSFPWLQVTSHNGPCCYCLSCTTICLQGHPLQPCQSTYRSPPQRDLHNLLSTRTPCFLLRNGSHQYFLARAPTQRCLTVCTQPSQGSVQHSRVTLDLRKREDTHTYEICQTVAWAGSRYLL